MRTTNTETLLDVEAQIAFLADNQEMQQVRDEIAREFACYGNPRVLTERLLESWRPYLPRLVKEGVLLLHATHKDRREYELADPHRHWLPPEEIVREYKVEAGADRYNEVFDRYIKRYGLNPGVRDALYAARRELAEKAPLRHHLNEMSRQRANRLLRLHLVDSWPSLIDQLVKATTSAEVRELLGEISFQHDGKQWTARFRWEDFIALTKARTIRDVEFILDRIEVVQLES